MDREIAGRNNESGSGTIRYDIELSPAISSQPLFRFGGSSREQAGSSDLSSQLATRVYEKWWSLEGSIPNLPRQTSRTFHLGAGLETALAALAKPHHRILAFGDEARFGTPRDDELSCPPATGDTMHHHRFPGGMMEIHEFHKVIDLILLGHAVIRDVDEIIIILEWDILSVVEFANIHHGLDPLLLKDVENIRVRPPRGRDDAFDDPGERLSPFRLPFLGPIPRSNCLTRLWPDWFAKQLPLASQ